MTNKICDGCETVAHCLKNVCVPKTSKQTEALKLALGYMDGSLVTDHLTGYERKRHVMEAICEALTSGASEDSSGTEQSAQYKSTGWVAHRDQYAVPVLFNPYTGQPRDVRDVQSDPQGILIVPPGKVEMLAAKPTCNQSLQVEQPAQPEKCEYCKRGLNAGICYCKPAQRKPLTDEEIWQSDAIMSANSGYGATFETLREVVRAIEAAHGIKE